MWRWTMERFIAFTRIHKAARGLCTGCMTDSVAQALKRVEQVCWTPSENRRNPTSITVRSKKLLTFIQSIVPAPSLCHFAIVFAAPGNSCLGRLRIVRTVFHVPGSKNLLLSLRSLQDENVTVTELKSRVQTNRIRPAQICRFPY